MRFNLETKSKDSLMWDKRQCYFNFKSKTKDNLILKQTILRKEHLISRLRTMSPILSWTTKNKNNWTSNKKEHDIKTMKRA